MRTLKFIVDSVTLKENPNCNFAGLFPDPNQQIEVEFSFSEEWNSAVKVAAFYSVLGKEFPPQIINKEGRCKIPPEALALPVFRMQIIGATRGLPLSTNTLSIYQKGGKT